MFQESSSPGLRERECAEGHSLWEVAASWIPERAGFAMLALRVLEIVLTLRVRRRGIITRSVMAILQQASPYAPRSAWPLCVPPDLCGDVLRLGLSQARVLANALTGQTRAAARTSAMTRAMSASLEEEDEGSDRQFA